MKKFFVFLMCLCILEGCTASHCIKVSGQYEGIDGNLTYCYSPEKSAKEGNPVLQSSVGDAYLLSEQDVADLAAIASTSPQPVAKTLEAATPCQQLCERLRIFRNQPAK